MRKNDKNEYNLFFILKTKNNSRRKALFVRKLMSSTITKVIESINEDKKTVPVE